jgi:hypothetical protein
VRAAIAATAMLLAGCAQLLGLDNTSLAESDAAGDASTVCSGAPLCTSAAGRSVCGQLFQTGATAGSAFTVANPTGAVCAADNLEGPCALQVAGNSKVNFFNGDATADVIGQIDDCGRFAVIDLDPTATDVAVKFTDAMASFRITATLVLGRLLEVGEDRDVPAYAVLTQTATDWATQLNPDTPPDLTTGYLVKYTNSSGVALSGEAVAVDSGSALTNPPGTIPWAGYFAGATEFGMLDVAATVTALSGTALTVLPAGPFSLEGFRQGRRCVIPDLRSVSNTLIHVVEDDC